MKNEKQGVSDVKPVSALIGASVGVFLIGFFQFLTEVSGSFKASMNIYPPIGSLSGKILFSYLIGILVYYAALRIMKNRRPDIKKHFFLLVAAVVVSSLLSLTPVTDIIIGG